MPSPFPGMDPYLETPELWPDVHHRLISEIQSNLNPRLRPRYVARVELRVYVSDLDDPGLEVIVPDVRVEKTRNEGGQKGKAGSALVVTEPLIIPLFLDEIEEARLEILEVRSGSLVTIIELLSPANKIRGSRGRDSFMKKRAEVLASDVHWVEIDLLRAGNPSIGRPALKRSDYRVLVSRSGQRPKGEFWPVNLRQPLPTIRIPLRGDDPAVPLDLGAVLKAAYEQGAYDLSIDYRHRPQPPLGRRDAAWAEKLLRAKGLRH